MPGDQGRPSILGDGLDFLIYSGPGNIKPYPMFLVTGATFSKSVYASLRMTNLVLCLAQTLGRNIALGAEMSILGVKHEPYVPQM